MYEVEGGHVERIETQMWASPREGLSLDELIVKMSEIGNAVLQVDRENNRILVSQEVRTFDRPGGADRRDA